MNKEIFKNEYIQILYDDKTDMLSVGYFPGTLTEYEKILLCRVFKGSL